MFLAVPRPIEHVSNLDHEQTHASLLQIKRSEYKGRVVCCRGSVFTSLRSAQTCALCAALTPTHGATRRAHYT